MLIVLIYHFMQFYKTTVQTVQCSYKGNEQLIVNLKGNGIEWHLTRKSGLKWWSGVKFCNQDFFLFFPFFFCYLAFSVNVFSCCNPVYKS